MPSWGITFCRWNLCFMKYPLFRTVSSARCQLSICRFLMHKVQNIPHSLTELASNLFIVHYLKCLAFCLMVYVQCPMVSSFFLLRLHVSDAKFCEWLPSSLTAYVFSTLLFSVNELLQSLHRPPVICVSRPVLYVLTSVYCIMSREEHRASCLNSSLLYASLSNELHFCFCDELRFCQMHYCYFKCVSCWGTVFLLMHYLSSTLYPHGFDQIDAIGLILLIRFVILWYLLLNASFFVLYIKAILRCIVCPHIFMHYTMSILRFVSLITFCVVHYSWTLWI